MYQAPLQKTFCGVQNAAGRSLGCSDRTGNGVGGGDRGGQRDLQIFLILESSGRTAAWRWLSRAQGGPKSEAPRAAQAGYLDPGLFAASSGGSTSSNRVGTNREFCRFVQIIQVDQRKEPRQVVQPTSVPPAGTSCPLLASAGMTGVSFRDSP